MEPLYCPHTHGCPHRCAEEKEFSFFTAQYYKDRYAQGTQYLIALDQIKALKAENEALRKENGELKAKLKQARQSKFKPNRKPRTQASGNRGKRPRRGAPAGHPPWQRETPNEVDHTKQIEAPAQCPHCNGENLTPTGNTQEQIQEDIILQPRTVVTKFVHQLAYCNCCRREVYQTGENELRNCKIGPVAKAVAVYLRHTVKLSYRSIEQVFDKLFGMSFVPASAMAFSHQSAKQAHDIYEDLKNAVQQSKVIHADETYWRVDGKTGYLWYAGNQDLAFFHADPSRSSEVAISILGDCYEGGLIADSYAGYNAVNALHRQACLAHLIRKAEEIAQRIESNDSKDQNALNFCNNLAGFFAHCCSINKDREQGRISFSEGKSKIPQLEKELTEICKNRLLDKDAENLRNRVLDPKRDGLRLFTFLKIKGMAPTNNHAEQALRLPVIMRKITFGSRSQVGADAMAINLSILESGKKKGVDPIHLLQTVILSGNDKMDTSIFDQIKNNPNPPNSS